MARQMQSDEVTSFEYFLDQTFELFSFIGLFGLQVWQNFVKGTASFYKKHIRKYIRRADTALLNTTKIFSKIYKLIIFKIYMFLKFFVDAKNVVVSGFNSRKKAPLPIKICHAIGAFFRGVRNNLNIFKWVISYTLPVLAAFAFINVIEYVSQLNFAVAVEYNGEHIGYVENEAVFEQAEHKLQQRIIYTEGEDALSQIPMFAVTVVDKSQLKTDYEVTDTMIRSSAGEIVQATGLSIDGKFYGAVKDGVRLQTTLQKLKDVYKTDTPGETVDFAYEVKTEPGIYRTTNLVDEEALLSTITAQTEKEAFYTVVSGDTPIVIAAKNDMSLDELTALNPDILENCKIGKQVQIKRAQAFLPVKVSREEIYTQSVKYETTYTESKKLYIGQQRTAREGVNGTNEIKATVEYVDGVEVGRTVLSTRVIEEPVAAVIEKGSAPLPKVTGNYGGKVADSGFMWPVSGGYISQKWGRSHNGIDYAYRGTGHGAPIWAAVGGTVTYAGWRGTYGNLVVVTSPGGIETWYAHCSSLLVSKGEVVEQGQQIARVGNTGRSFGAHLHFRVLVNGVEKNPLNYLP